MRQDRKLQRRKKQDDGWRRLLPVIIVPLIVIILMVIIVVADHKKENKGSGPSETAEGMVPADGQGSTEPGGPGADGEGLVGQEPAGADGEGNMGQEPAGTDGEGTEPEDAYATDSFRRDSVPEILDLMRSYFKARAEADAEAMNRIYGMGEISEAELEEQKARMRSNSKYVQNFENVATYVMGGTTPDAWLVYAIADIRFLSVKTTAPMIMWCYVRKDAEGNYRIVDNASLSENVQQFIDVANHSEEVRRLASSVNVRLKEALTADEELNSVYGVLRDGSPVWQGGEDGPEVVIDGGAADSAGSSGGGSNAGAAGAGAGGDNAGRAEDGAAGENDGGAGNSAAGGSGAAGSGEAGVSADAAGSGETGVPDSAAGSGEAGASASAAGSGASGAGAAAVNAAEVRISQ